MSIVFKIGTAAALGMALSVSAAQATSLGLMTSGPVDTGPFEVSYFGAGGLAAFGPLAAGGPSNLFFDPDGVFDATFDSGGDLADIVAIGFDGGVVEFQLSAFDGYTNGALLMFDFTSAGLFNDPLTSVFAGTTFSATGVNGVLQGIASTTTPIPLPAGALLLGTALAGLGFSRKRRTA